MTKKTHRKPKSHKQPVKDVTPLRKLILSVLEANDGYCMDNDNERHALADALVAALVL